LTRARHYNLVYLHARRRPFPAFAEILLAVQEIWPWGEVASVEEVASRLAGSFPANLIEATIWKLVGDSLAAGHLVVDLEQHMLVSRPTQRRGLHAPSEASRRAERPPCAASRMRAFLACVSPSFLTYVREQQVAFRGCKICCVSGQTEKQKCLFFCSNGMQTHNEGKNGPTISTVVAERSRLPDLSARLR
jgi:hypothetical protein